MFAKTSIDYDYISANAGSWVTHGAFATGQTPDPDLASLLERLREANHELSVVGGAAKACFEGVVDLIWERVQDDAEFKVAADAYQTAARDCWAATLAHEAADLAVKEAAAGRDRKVKLAAAKALAETRWAASARLDECEKRLQMRVEAHIPGNLDFDGTSRIDKVLKMHLRAIKIQTLRAASN